MDLRPVRDADLAEAAGVFATSMGGHPRDDDAERAAAYWHLDRSWVAVHDQRIVGVTTGYASRLSLAGGGSVACTAVPNVGVLPDAQGLGAGRRLLEHQVRAAAASGDAVLALNASETGIYGRFGYGPTSAWWTVELDPRRVAWRPDAPVPGPVSEVTAAEGRAALVELYGRSFGRWPGEVDRHDGWWDRRLRRRPGDDTPLRVALHHDEDGRVDAAATHTVVEAFDDGSFANRCTVRDLVAADDAAQARLLRWLLSRRLLGRLSMETFDPGSALPWMLADPRQLHTRDLGDAVWVRVLDLPAVLGARATTHEGTVVLAVVDDLVPDVAGCWRVEGAGGRLTCQPTTDAPDVVLDTDLVAPLVWSWASASRLAAAGRLAVHDPAALAVLDRLLAWHRPSWCSTSF